MTYFYMAKVMRQERVRLGLEAFDLHALRYRSIKELAWAECDDDEITANSGHATKAKILKYAGEARLKMRARQAREKTPVNRTRSEQEIDTPSDTIRGAVTAMSSKKWCPEPATS